MEELKFLGAWDSPFTARAIWALKLKGIPYQYIEEDLYHKSELLLKYNPVHKKVPVLVHDGKPICESMIIVQHLDDTWPHKYPLLPSDPYQRTLAHFWVKFAEDKVYISTTFLSIYYSNLVIIICGSFMCSVHIFSLFK